MATFEERQKQYEENDVPAAWRTYVANGIRKKFADQFDFNGMSDQEVIQRHHARFGADMEPSAYKDKLDETYGKGFTAPPAPTKTLMDRAGDVGEAAKGVAEGIVPFAIPEVGKAIAAGSKAVATKIPVASQIGFLGAHTVNAAADVAAANALEKTSASLPVPDEATKTQEFYDKLLPGLSARGYTPDQVMQEAQKRAQNITRGYQKTTESIDQDVEAAQTKALTEPAKAAADAFFLGVGAPMIEGVLQKGLAKIGIGTAGAVAAKPAEGAIGRLASHIRTGAVIGAPGMGIQGAITAGVQAAADNKTPAEIGQALVKGGTTGVKEGALGGALIGGAAGALEAGVGAVAKPFAERVRKQDFRETKAQADLDEARLRGWQDFNAQQHAKSTTGVVRATQQAERAEQVSREAIARTGSDFDPHTTQVPLEGDPAEIATTIIQQQHGDDAALSEVGLRAASQIADRIQLYQDANADLKGFEQRELPPQEAAPAQPEITGSELPPVGSAATSGPPLGPVETGGRPLAPPTEPNPRLEPAPSEVTTPETSKEAQATTATPRPAPPVSNPGEVTLPTRAGAAVSQIDVGKHAVLGEAEGGNAIHLERLGLPAGEIAKPGAVGQALDTVVKKADEHQVPVVTRITQVAGPRGGRIPIEKMIPWYEQRGFKLVDSTKLPEGQMATATLRRIMMERAMARPETPVARELAAPATTPGPGRWHQTDLWADSNIAAARERIKQREAEFPEQERLKQREGGYLGDREQRDPTSYDWADFADRVQIGVNMILKHGLNKAEWVERMVSELGDKFRNIAERVYQESVAAFNARRPKGIDEVRQVVDDYVHQAGLGRGATRHDVYPPVDPKFGARVAMAYHLLDNVEEGSKQHAEAAQSYEALNHEIEAQYKAMTDAGYKVTFTRDDPYATSADMRSDVAQNKHIKAFKTGEEFHPFMTPEQNDRLRAVHDFFGHAAEGYEFGPRGEDAAFRKHASTLSSKAIPALATETRGQNSWVNYWPANAKLEPKDRPFAEQKFGLLPRWVYEDVLNERDQRAQSNKLATGMVQLGTRGEGRAIQTAAEKLARGIRPVKAAPAVRARFVANGTDAVNEMMSVSPESATWYHDDIERMHKLTEQEIPSMRDPGHRALFDLLLGFTSPSTNVPQNYARAFSLMRDFERSGKVPFLQRFGQEVNIGSRKWVPRLNGLIEKFGGDLDQMRDYLLAKDPETGVYNAEKEFGDKVGPFTLNIQGIHDQITVDVWMVRRLRRLAGTLYKTEDGKKVLDEDWVPSAQERRDIEESIHELSRRTGLDPDAVQAILWDNEKMVWERAGLAAPRIPFSVAAEGVLRNVRAQSSGIEQKYSQERLPF